MTSQVNSQMRDSRVTLQKGVKDLVLKLGSDLLPFWISNFFFYPYLIRNLKKDMDLRVSISFHCDLGKKNAHNMSIWLAICLYEIGY